MSTIALEMTSVLHAHTHLLQAIVLCGINTNWESERKGTVPKVSTAALLQISSSNRLVARLLDACCRKL
jgi:hypothetical protein